MSVVKLTDAARHFASVFSDIGLATDVAPTLTCIEVNALVDVLRFAGHEGMAQEWMTIHAEKDEPGDLHYLGDETEN